jgi:hypothetical protein
MTKNSEQDGPATDLARQAADKAHQAAGWFGRQGPGHPVRRGPVVLRPPQTGHLPGNRARRRRPGGPTAPRSDRLADDTPSSTTDSTSTDPSAGLLSAGPTQFDDSDPIGGPVGSIPPALGDGLPQSPAPMGGLGAGGAWADPRGEMAP